MNTDLKDPYAKAAIISAIVLGLIAPTIICFDMSSPTRIEITNSHIHFQGSGGIWLSYDEIEEVEEISWQDIPTQVERLKGGSSSSYQKGLFSTSVGEQIHLYIHNPKEAEEIIHINRTNGPDVYFTTNDNTLLTELNMAMRIAKSDSISIQ